MNRDEVFDVYRVLKPSADREEFEREWDLFQRAKAEYLEKRKIQ